MAKIKEIIYPTTEWLDSWIDTYLDKHPNEKIDDFKLLEEKAHEVWWDKQIDLGNPTPYDLTKEQEKASKKARSTTSNEPKKKTTSYKFDKKTRPKDAEKVEIIKKIADFLKISTEKCEIINEGQEISFFVGENHYSLKLTKHRAPKK